MGQNDEMTEQGQSVNYSREDVINTLLQQNAGLTRENAILNAIIKNLMEEKQQTELAKEQ